MDNYSSWQGRIWYVDDSEILVRIAELSLKFAFPNAHIKTFPSGITALAEYDANRSNRPDLLLTDYVMVPMTGGELIREFRKRKPGLPAAIFTATPENAKEDAAELQVPVFDKKEINKISPSLANLLYALAVKQ